MMKRTKKKIVDLIVENSPDRQSVGQRIENKLELLKEWLRDGVPSGKSVPESLKAARLWEDPELNIKRISSPNEFTTTHTIHGSRVRDIAEVLTALRRTQKGDSNEKNRRAHNRAKHFDQKLLKHQLSDIVSQWHTERDGHLKEKYRADAAETRNTMLQKEISEKNQIIEDLHRQLSRHRTPRIVE